MAAIAIRCGCGETHRILTSAVLASTWRKPPARSTDCRMAPAKPIAARADPQVLEVQDEAAGGELAAAFG